MSFPALNPKKLRIFQADRRGRREQMISPASNAKTLRIFQANRRGRRAMSFPALKAKKLRSSSSW